jgi:transcriptional regulator with GAF, ATPase, and Fis domain
VLQEGVFERVGATRSLHSDFRLVTATNRDLLAEVRAGRFREDLYYRLAAFSIGVPALWERPEDIPTLALCFLERIARNLGRRFDGIGEADMQRLVAWHWPGNVRELQHVIERAALLSDGPRLRIAPLGTGRAAPVGETSPVAAGAAEPTAGEPVGALETLEAVERRHVAAFSSTPPGGSPAPEALPRSSASSHRRSTSVSGASACEGTWGGFDCWD